MWRAGEPSDVVVDGIDVDADCSQIAGRLRPGNIKSQIVPPSWQLSPPGLLASPANAGVNGRENGSVSAKLSPAYTGTVPVPSHIAVPALVGPGSVSVRRIKGCGGNTQLKGDEELHDVIAVS